MLPNDRSYIELHFCRAGGRCNHVVANEGFRMFNTNGHQLAKLIRNWQVVGSNPIPGFISQSVAITIKKVSRIHSISLNLTATVT